MQETQVRFLLPLKKGMAAHSSLVAWRITWAEESGGLQSMGLQSWTSPRDKGCQLSTWTLMSLFPCHHRSQGNQSGCRVSSKHTWASDLGLSRAFFLVHWTVLIITPSFKPTLPCMWLMTLGHVSGFRVLNRPLGLSFHQEMPWLYRWLPEFAHQEQKTPGNTLNQDFPGGSVVKTPHFLGAAGSTLGQGTKISGWEKWQRTDSLTVGMTLKLTFRSLELGNFFSFKNSRNYKNYCLAFSVAWESTESVSEWYITDWMDKGVSSQGEMKTRCWHSFSGHVKGHWSDHALSYEDRACSGAGGGD